MCAACAVRERSAAVHSLRLACERRFGLGPALQAVFTPAETDPDFDDLCRRLSGVFLPLDGR